LRIYRSIILSINVDGELSPYLMTETNMDLKMFVKKKIECPIRKSAAHAEETTMSFSFQSPSDGISAT
jgi:hypothetical protein